jgi:hypothetical protein
MAVSLELHNTGDSGGEAEVRALVEHALSDRPGEWRVSIVGSRENDDWEMKILGANGFQRSYTLVGSAGRAPAFGDRVCADEVGAGDDAAGLRLSPRRRRESANGLSEVDPLTKVYRTSSEERVAHPARVRSRGQHRASTTKLRQKTTMANEGHRK